MANKKWHSKQVVAFDASYDGAMGGIFWLEEDAKEILGELNYGEAFAYLFRRFGYPLFGWDGHKTLVNYYLTTPMDGVVLIVEPTVCDVCPCGYMLRKDLDRECIEEESKPFRDWIDKMHAWAKREHNIEFCEMLEQDKEKLKRVWTKWLEEKHPEIELANQITDKIEWAFFAEQRHIEEKYAKLYEEIEPRPKNVEIADLPDTSIRKKCHKALCTTIRDLLTPVNVRDSLINVKGKVDDDEWDNSIEYSEMAGYGVAVVEKSSGDKKKLRVEVEMNME